MERTSLILPFLPQMPSLTLELSQKAKKTMFLNKFLNIPSILNLSLPLFLSSISNLNMPTNIFLIEVYQPKFRFKILFLSKVIEEKPLVGRLEASTPSLTLNRTGFLQIGMAGEGRFCSPLCNFCLNGPIDLRFGM